jgi:outer membrane protein assembly factor BamD
MFSKQRKIVHWLVAGGGSALLILSGCGGKKYENPIAKDTLQPDKVLFDKAIKDVEKGRYEIARLTLQTLISTYDTSEYLAKSKLAIADSWFREGGSHGLAQAEAEYKDFILFYPTLEEAAEAQEKVCMIHYRQMMKPDRDTTHALRAEDECRQLLVQFPNSRFAPRAQQLLREIQEVLAEHEFRVGRFYHNKGSYPSAANRLQAVTDHYPLFSQADESLWRLGDAYTRMGQRFRDKSISAYQRIVRDYPLSPYADEAKRKLTGMEAQVPEPDPVALARMKYELENTKEPGMMSHFWGIFRQRPDVSQAAKSGEPSMTALRPSVPASVPAAGGTSGAPTAEVTLSPVTDSTALDTRPEARRSTAGAKPVAAGESATQPGAASQETKGQKDQKKKEDKKKKAPK